jgi:hypothetical protein
MAREGLEIPV